MSILTYPIILVFFTLQARAKNVISKEESFSVKNVDIPKYVGSNPVSICSQENIIGTSGTISSPSWPENYPSNLLCNKTIIIPQNKVLELVFLSFLLEDESSCDYDYVQIYADQELYGNTKYCGDRKPRVFHTRKQTSVTIGFRSDVSSAKSGFLASWTFKDRCNATEFTCWDTTCIPFSKHCDGIKDCSDDSDEIECARTPSSVSECGKPSTSPQFPWSRIIGGSESQSGSWPWQVGLLIAPVGSNTISFFCGGSVISEGWILSAAHCLDDSSTHNDILVRVGTHSWNSNDGQSFRVDTVIVHPLYTSSANGIHYDVALIKIQGKISWTDNVRPVCLPTPGTYISNGTVCIATGWGSLYNDQSVLPDNLMQVRLPIVTRTECRYAYGSQIDDKKVCIGDKIQGGIDTCSGDSGGPLVCLLDEQVWIQVGVTSYGIGCADKNYPGVYARVASHTNWIQAELSFFNGTASIGQPSSGNNVFVSTTGSFLSCIGLVILSCLLS